MLPIKIKEKGKVIPIPSCSFASSYFGVPNPKGWLGLAPCLPEIEFGNTYPRRCVSGVRKTETNHYNNKNKKNTKNNDSNNNKTTPVPSTIHSSNS